MGSFLSRSLLFWKLSSHKDIVTYLLLSHRALTQFVDKLTENPSWINGSFDVCGNMTAPENELEIIQLEAGRIVELYKPLFLSFHEHSTLNHSLINITNHVTFTRDRKGYTFEEH